MSSDVTSRAQALCEKAYELKRKGHLLRAAENYGRAAEAARTLGEDNLVTLYLQLRQANLLFVSFSAATTMHGVVADPCVVAANRAEFISLLSGVVAALERRRAAGTLLEGKCTAAEEAWRVRECHRHLKNNMADEAARRAALFGYEVFLHVALEGLAVLQNVPVLAADCPGALLHHFTQHVVRAAELMQQPRRFRTAMPFESAFIAALHKSVADAPGAVASGFDARLVQLLESAWLRLQRSGVLESRHIERRHVRDMVDDDKMRVFDAAVQSSLTAPDRRFCALDGCGAREAHPAHFKSCAACRAVVYCCREHQVEGWPAHKKTCKAARNKAAAADSDKAGPSGA